MTTTDSFHRTGFPATVHIVIGTERYCLEYDFQNIWALRDGADTYLRHFQQVFQAEQGEARSSVDEDDVRRLASQTGLGIWRNYTDFNGEMVGDIVCAMMPVVTQCLLAGEDFLEKQTTGRLPHWANPDLPSAYQDGGRAILMDAFFLIAGELNRRSGGALAKNSFNQQMVFTDETAKPEKKAKARKKKASRLELC